MLLVSIPPSRPVPQKGNVIDVRCLYAFQQSCATYQPAYLGARDDALAEERVVDQLKFKPQGETVRPELTAAPAQPEA